MHSKGGGEGDPTAIAHSNGIIYTVFLNAREHAI